MALGLGQCLCLSGLKSGGKLGDLQNGHGFSDHLRPSRGEIVQGINGYLYIAAPADPDYGVWRRAIDPSGATIDPQFHEWINYAPQMLDVPCNGVNTTAAGEWIHRKLQKDDGALVWNDGAQGNRKSPGYSFQAVLCWLDMGQSGYAESALNWADNSGLWHSFPDYNNVTGGWVDWKEESAIADWWLRFIDTSFYAIAAYNGGYDFNIVPNRDPVLSPIGNKQTAEGELLQFSLQASDADGDELRYFVENAPSGAALNGQTFAWTPDFTQAGKYEATFTVRDYDSNGIPKGGGDSETIAIVVANVDRTPPTGSILIENGAAYANKTKVALKLSATDTGGSGVYRMSLSNDNAQWSAWEAFSAAKSWTLTATNGAKNVYVKFSDKAGNVSAVYHDGIVLDTIQPSVKNIADMPDPFDPEAGQRAIISYVLNDNLSSTVYVEIGVYNSGGALVRTLEKSNRAWADVPRFGMEKTRPVRMWPMAYIDTDQSAG